MRQFPLVCWVCILDLVDLFARRRLPGVFSFPRAPASFYGSFANQGIEAISDDSSIFPPILRRAASIFGFCVLPVRAGPNVDFPVSRIALGSRQFLDFRKTPGVWAPLKAVAKSSRRECRANTTPIVALECNRAMLFRAKPVFLPTGHQKSEMSVRAWPRPCRQSVTRSRASFSAPSALNCPKV